MATLLPPFNEALSIFSLIPQSVQNIKLSCEVKRHGYTIYINPMILIFCSNSTALGNKVMTLSYTNYLNAAL